MGPSFRDATRVAGANSAIWTDIYMSNRDALIAAIDELRALGRCARRSSGDAPAVRLERARARRPERCSARGWPVAGRRAARGVPTARRDRRDRARARQRGVNIVDMALSLEDNSQGVVALWIGGDEHAGARRR